jgi:hypothetical protein
MDTIIDRLPTGEDLPPSALAFLKAIYLAFRPLQDCARECGWTQTELIDAAETLRRKGGIKLVYDKAAGAISIQITPFGSLMAAAQASREPR